jgi:hypothetical protein
LSLASVDQEGKARRLKRGVWGISVISLSKITKLPSYVPAVRCGWFSFHDASFERLSWLPDVGCPLDAFAQRCGFAWRELGAKRLSVLRASVLVSQRVNV